MTFPIICLSILLILIQGSPVFGQERLPETAGVSGEVVFKGEKVPISQALRTNSDSEFCGDSVLSERIIVNPQTKTIKNAIVFLTPNDPELKIPSKSKPSISALLSFRCHFAPHVMVIQKGAPLYIKNGDPILHSFHLYMNNKSLFNLVLPGGPTIIQKEFSQERIVHVKCDIHEFMEGFILVSSSPLFAATREDGLFEFDHLVSGDYTLSVWHEVFGKLEKSLHLKIGEHPYLSLGIKP